MNLADTLLPCSHHVARNGKPINLFIVAASVHTEVPSSSKFVVLVDWRGMN